MVVALVDLAIRNVTESPPQQTESTGDAVAKSPSHGMRRLGWLGWLRRPRAFVSSTGTDLEPQRDAVAGLLGELGFDVLTMKDFPAMAHSPSSGSRDMVRQTDVLVGIYARWYGTVDAVSGLSVTELEYDAARAAGLPVLAHVLSADARWPAEWTSEGRAGEQQSAFRRRVMSELIVAKFDNPMALLTAVSKSARAFMQLDRRRRWLRLAIAFGATLTGVAIVGAAILRISAEPTFGSPRLRTDLLAPLKSEGPAPEQIGGITVKHAEYIISALSLDPDCVHAIVGTERGALLRDGASPQVKPLQGETKPPVLGLALQPNAPCLLSWWKADSPVPSRLQCVDPDTLEPRWSFSPGSEVSVTDSIWSYDAGQLWAGTDNGHIFRLSAASGESIEELTLPQSAEDDGEWIWGLAVNRSGTRLLVPRHRAGLYIVDLGKQGGRPVIRKVPMPEHLAWVDRAVFTDSGMVVAAVRIGARSQLLRYDPLTGHMTTFGNHERLWQRIWSLGGEYVVTVLNSGLVDVWDVRATALRRVGGIQPESPVQESSLAEQFRAVTLCDERVLSMVMDEQQVSFEIRWLGLGDVHVPAQLRTQLPLSW